VVEWDAGRGGEGGFVACSKFPACTASVAYQ
jgi:hypothetical protein